MNKKRLETLRQELDQQGCDTFRWRGEAFDAEYVSYSAIDDEYGYNIDLDAIAKFCRRSSYHRQVSIHILSQVPQHWKVRFELGEDSVEIIVHTFGEDEYETEIIGIECYLRTLPDLVLFAQKYLQENWRRVTKELWEKM